MMLIKIIKWINSLAVRIPSNSGGKIKFSETISDNGTSLDCSISIKTVGDNYGYRLDDLINQVNKNNLHGEYDSGKQMGKEIW